ncbi:FAD/NAD(P)-binding domain-containing protein [Mytilinidion resinicola]|uniref:FAD/NAD(P)-binding domain-containing protein n=1 Tax=Mytilinidion resinicola TaxID=574789 RepID=A0A6A6YDS7_9PEZI|nr:FAD/NAD(P)-binding domain-containing protein [Mytilinidion resinicola]KAF2806982.1 FAD/NAD(P)-binding domain-containing protein [Mytilinidion resinicola]
MAPRPKVMEKLTRDDASKLDIVIVGAGLGGLGAAIALLLAGHCVHILEGASQIGEVGAGIQVLPNSSRVLISWGMEQALESYATKPKQANMLGWKGNYISHMDFHKYEQECGTPFWDFHRANLHKCLLDRAVELGAVLEVNARVVDVVTAVDERTADVVMQNGTRRTADLVVGADGINSKCREILLGKEDPPILTGDLAYRLLLKTEDMMKDPQLRGFVEDPQVNYWMGPDAHAVNYVLRGGELFNMVLLVPDDMPAGASTLAGNVEEMRALYKDWDPRIPKLLNLCQSVDKWRLCIRPTLEPSWSHPSGAFTTLGDAVHATLPYLASGAGMSLEDGHVLGLCLSRLTSKAPAEKKKALAIYEECRRSRTERIVQRGNVQQHLYHVHDGPKQRERDELLRAFGARENDGVAPTTVDLVEGKDPLPWRWGGVGKWLLTYDCDKEVEEHWKPYGASEMVKTLAAQQRAHL